jgi:hypothetical protein
LKKLPPSALILRKHVAVEPHWTVLFTTSVTEKAHFRPPQPLLLVRIVGTRAGPEGHQGRHGGLYPATNYVAPSLWSPPRFHGKGDRPLARSATDLQDLGPGANSGL